MALTNKLTAIADAIRTKTGGSSPLSLDDMATAIGNLSTSSDPVIENKIITQNGTYTVPSGVDGYSPIVVNVDQSAPVTKINNIIPPDNRLDWGTINGFVSNNPTYFDSTITIKNISSGSSYTNSCNGIDTLSKYIIDYSTKTTQGQLYCMYLFNNGKLLTNDNTFPTILYDENMSMSSTHSPSFDFSYMFYGCQKITSVPTAIKDLISFKFSHEQSYVTSRNISITSTFVNMFSNCYNLKDIDFMYRYFDNTLSSYSNSNVCLQYTSFLSNNLPKVRNIHLPNIMCTTSIKFDMAPQYIGCSSFTIAPFKYSGEWYTNKYFCLYANPVIDLTKLGYSATSMTTTMAGNKRITNASTYTQYKDDPDAWTTDLNYSFYNHDSAVETINSFPNLKKHTGVGTYTGTIKFLKKAGTNTDGGAISTLTSAEKAVATQKGWTITLS